MDTQPMPFVSLTACSLLFGRVLQKRPPAEARAYFPRQNPVIHKRCTEIAIALKSDFWTKNFRSPAPLLGET